MDVDEEQIQASKKWRVPGLVAALLILFGLFWVPVTNLFGEDSQAVQAEESRLIEGQDATPATLSRLHLVSKLPGVYSSTQVSGDGIVGQIVGDRGFWLRHPRSSKRTFVILGRQEDRVWIRQGQKVWVQGHVFQTRGLNSDTMEELRPATQAVLKKERVFIHAPKLLSLESSEDKSGLAMSKSQNPETR